jgi:hypothetical protein
MCSFSPSCRLGAPFLQLNETCYIHSRNQGNSSLSKYRRNSVCHILCRQDSETRIFPGFCRGKHRTPVTIHLHSEPPHQAPTLGSQGLFDDSGSKQGGISFRFRFLPPGREWSCPRRPSFLFGYFRSAAASSLPFFYHISRPQSVVLHRRCRDRKSTV